MMDSTFHTDLHLRSQSAGLAERAEARRARLEALDARTPRARSRRHVPAWIAHPVRALRTLSGHRPAAA